MTLYIVSSIMLMYCFETKYFLIYYSDQTMQNVRTFRIVWVINGTRRNVFVVLTIYAQQNAKQSI
jgi:hypothetical protein